MLGLSKGKHTHQLLYEYIKRLKRILIWNRVSIRLLHRIRHDFFICFCLLKPVPAYTKVLLSLEGVIPRSLPLKPQRMCTEHGVKLKANKPTFFGLLISSQPGSPSPRLPRLYKLYRRSWDPEPPLPQSPHQFLTALLPHRHLSCVFF